MFCLRVITEARHLLRDNPALSALEKIRQKDLDYVMMLEYIHTNHNFRDLPPRSEGFRMSGKWPSLEILPEFKVIILRERNNVSKIYSQRCTDPSFLKNCTNLGGSQTLSI